MSRLLRLFLAAVLAPLAAVATAQDRQAVERQFQAWLGKDIWHEAAASGVSRSTFESALAGVALDWSLPELRPPGVEVKPPTVEWQAEFSKPANYFNEGRLAGLVAQGRQQLSRWRQTLDAVAARYGVPAPILVAVWAKESSFGQAKLPEPAIRALATQAFMGRRADFFRNELVAALVILENGDIAPERMRSSWAGALGQPQFLPSQFHRYAVDFDGDGHRDIWDSVPDSLASMANYLRQEGWRPERGWGVEARIPESVPCTLEGPEQRITMAEWARRGVTRADGPPLPVTGDRLGYLLMPAGRFGPAFIVTENFYTLKQYNYSDLYALYVGHLADRLQNNRRFEAGWRNVGGFSRGDVKRMQEALIAEGHDVGGADGLIGFKTRIAVGLWQAKTGRPVTCFPDRDLIRSIH